MPIVHHNTKSNVDKLADKLTLSEEQFEIIAKQTEEKAAHDYAGYKKQLIAFASLGYLYIGAVVALLLGLVAVTCWLSFAGHRIYVGAIKIVFVLVILVFLVLKSLWVKNDPPTGIELERKDFPELFSLLDEICTKLNTTADKVLLNSDFNAAVYQHPRFGLLGFNTNYLLLGMPFLQCLTKEELRAILAHEFGHLSGKHSQTSLWIYSLRERWSNILNQLGEKSFLFYPFFMWYMPRFIAYSMIMIRNHEKDADADSVKITGPEPVGKSLMVVSLKGRHLSEEIWQDVYKKARTQEEAPLRIYSEIGERINELPTRKLRQWLDEELKDEGSKIATHPPIRERLALCGQLEKYENMSDADLEKLVAPIPIEQSAAAVLLGSKLPDLTDKVSTEWHNGVKELWQQRHQYYVQVQEEINKLDAKEQQESLNINDLKQKAYLLEELDENKEAIPLYYRILEQNPSDAIANFSLGAYITRKHKQENLNGDEALKHLEESFKTDIRLAHSAKYLALNYLREEKRHDETIRFEKYDKEIEEALKERGELKDTEELIPALLDEDEKEAVISMCQSVEQITEMYVVQKKVHLFPESKHFVLGAKVYAKGADDEFRLSMANIIMQYFNQFPGTKSVVVFDMWTKKLEQKIKDVPGSEVFKR